MIIKISKILLLGAVFFSFFSGIAFAETEAVEEKMIIHFFHDRLCPVCRNAKNFIEGLLDDYPQVDLRVYPISDTAKLHETAQEYRVEDYRIMAPTIFIGENFFQFRDFTSREKEMLVKAIEGEIVEAEDCCLVGIFNTEISIKDLPLFVKTSILGFLDGFNLYSVVSLILAILIVTVFDSKKKLFFYGCLFIITAAVIYGLGFFVRLGIIELSLRQMGTLRIVMGVVTLCGGLFLARKWWQFFKYGPVSHLSDPSLKQGFKVPNKGTLLLVSYIIISAVVVTLIKISCFTGTPMAFASILAEAGITPGIAFMYIIVYLFFYMFIELVILTGAILTKKIWFAGSKLITWVTFAGAAVLFYLAFYYLFS